MGETCYCQAWTTTLVIPTQCVFGWDQVREDTCAEYENSGCLGDER